VIFPEYQSPASTYHAPKRTIGARSHELATALLTRAESALGSLTLWNVGRATWCSLTAAVARDPPDMVGDLVADVAAWCCAEPDILRRRRLGSAAAYIRLLIWATGRRRLRRVRHVPGATAMRNQLAALRSSADSGSCPTGNRSARHPSHR